MNKSRINHPSRFLPLTCWDVSITNRNLILKRADRDFDKSVILQYKKKFSWDINVERILDTPYEALVLTNQGIKIEWVNEGFTEMTGYDKRDVLGSSPKILQGKNTSFNTRKIIKEQLVLQKPFNASLINYRKNGEEYICGIEVHPIFNNKRGLSHFLAIEAEIK